MSALSRSSLRESQDVRYFKEQQHIDQGVIDSFATSVHTFVMDELRTHNTPSAVSYDSISASKYLEESAPAYTIKQRYFEKLEQRPGYEHNQQITSLSREGGCLSNAPRVFEPPNMNPPPNEYKIDSSFNKSTGSLFPTRIIQEPQPNENPAPNHYNPYTKALEMCPPAFSMRSRPKSVEVSNDIPFYRAHGQINTKGNTFNSASSELVIERTPGPENYAQRLPERSSRKYEILRRNYGSTDEETPAPCDYSHEQSTLRETGAGKFGSRTSREVYENPVGPGQYNVAPTKRIKGGAIGKGGRKSKIEFPNIGPGSYDTTGKLAAKDLHILSRYQKTASDNENPGPNAYSLSGSLSNAGARILNKGKSDAWIKRSDVPGPGQYDVPGSLQKPKMHDTFPRHREAGKRDNSPGPNEYNTRGEMSSVGFSMSFRSYGFTL